MPKYQCPECEAVLKRDSAVEPGKKIKCPKCETIFKPKAMQEDDPEDDSGEKEKSTKEKVKEKETKKKKKTKVTAEKAKSSDDEGEGGVYTFLGTDEDEEEAKPVEYGSLRDKFAKSKRGPAMSALVGPSNFIMGEGILICIGSIGLFIFAIWPFVFSEEHLSRDRTINQILMAVGGVAGFGLGCFLCYVASCMHELLHYKLVWTGCIIAAIPIVASLGAFGYFAMMKVELWAYPLIFMQGFSYGIYKSIDALSTQKVKDGFIETVEKANELKNL